MRAHYLQHLGLLEPNYLMFLSLGYLNLVNAVYSMAQSFYNLGFGDSFWFGFGVLCLFGLFCSFWHQFSVWAVLSSVFHGRLKDFAEKKNIHLNPILCNK